MGSFLVNGILDDRIALIVKVVSPISMAITTTSTTSTTPPLKKSSFE
jgi:hypothetical protein